MAYLTIPLEKIVEKLQRDYKCSRKDAQITAQRLEKLHSELHLLVEAWYRDEFKDFAVGDMSVSTFMEIQKTGYLNAIIWMDFFLENPDKVDLFREKRFLRR